MQSCVLLTEPDFQTISERTGRDKPDVGMKRHQIGDVAGQGSLLPPGAFDNGKRGGSSRSG